MGEDGEGSWLACGPSLVAIHIRGGGGRPKFSMLNVADECSTVSCKKEFKGHSDARLLQF